MLNVPDDDTRYSTGPSEIVYVAFDAVICNELPRFTTVGVEATMPLRNDKFMYGSLKVDAVFINFVYQLMARICSLVVLLATSMRFSKTCCRHDNLN